MNSFALQPQGFTIRLPIEAEKRKMPAPKILSCGRGSGIRIHEHGALGNDCGIERAHAGPGHAGRGHFAA